MLSNCSCLGCVGRGLICVPRGNAKILVVSVMDTDGDEFDISTSSEITFMVSDGVELSGNMGPGGPVRFTKLLSAGQIIISTNMYQFRVVINNADTLLLSKERNYYEIQVTAANGRRYTVGAGLFLSQATQIPGV